MVGSGNAGLVVLVSSSLVAVTIFCVLGRSVTSPFCFSVSSFCAVTASTLVFSVVVASVVCGVSVACTGTSDCEVTICLSAGVSS